MIKLSKLKHWTLTLIPLLILGILMYLHVDLLLKTFVIDGTGHIRTAISGYGDIPLHLTQVSKFAFGDFNLSEPIFYGNNLQYPFIINLISGLLLKLTSLWRLSFLLPVIVLAVLNIFLAYSIYRKLISNKILATLAVVVFLVGSGFGGWSIIQDAIGEGHTLNSFIGMLSEENISTATRWDAQYPEQNIGYGAPMSLFFLHQRPFIMGLTCFLTLITLLLALKDKPSTKYAILAGIIYGILPLVHAHTFMIFTVAMLVVLILSLYRSDKLYLKKLLIILGIAILIATPQVLYLMGDKAGVSTESEFLNFRIGWMVEPTIGSAQFPDENRTVFSLSYLKFIMINLGILFPAFILALILILLPKKLNKKIFNKTSRTLLLAAALSAIFIFLAAQLIRFQPWDYDNNKIFVYWQFFAVPLVFLLLYQLYKHTKLIGGTIIAVFLVFSLFSGIIDLTPRYTSKTENLPVIYDIHAQNLAQYVRTNTSKHDLVLTGASHLNPVIALAGKETLVGFPGWLWTRGIDYGDRLQKIEDFYKNPSQDQILKEFPISYILLDLQTNTDYKADLNTFDNLYTKVFESGQYTLYKI
ncbi:MAG: hypothetical protein ABH833_02520 [Parcubacteria group bacterium]